MLTRRSSSRFAALLAVVLAAPAASGQPAPKGGAPAKTKRGTIRDELPPQARKDWDAAKELFEAQDFQGALIQFSRAFELSSNPRVLFNVGVAHKSLKRYSRAIAVWERQLAEFGDKLQPEDIREVKAAIETVRPFVSTLEVTANEAGATLLVNEEVAGTTPLPAPVAIDVGRQTIKLRKAGFVEQKVEVEVASGTPATVKIKLEPTEKRSPVGIEVVGPPSARVFIDGVDMGSAPFKGDVLAGRHTFEARARGYEIARQTSEVTFGEPLQLKLTMGEVRREGKLRVVVGQSDAVIEVDDKVVGSGSWEGVLRQGGHQLTVKKSGFQTYTTDVAIDGDQVRRVNVSLVPDKGASWVWWTAGTIAVVAGGAVASYFVFRPGETAPVTGTFNPGTVTKGVWR